MLLENENAITQPLYLSDAHRREFDAVVIPVDADEHAVALDATAFFPTRGGQPNDTREITVPVVKTEFRGKASKRVRIAVDE